MKKIVALFAMMLIGFSLRASDNGPLCQLEKLPTELAEKVFFFNPLLVRTHSLFEFSIANRSKTRTVTIFPSRLSLPVGSAGLLDYLRVSRPALRGGGLMLVAYELTSLILDKGISECRIDAQTARYLHAAVPLVVGPDRRVTWLSGRGGSYKLYPDHRYMQLIVVPKAEEGLLIGQWSGAGNTLCEWVEELA